MADTEQTSLAEALRALLDATSDMHAGIPVIVDKARAALLAHDAATVPRCRMHLSNEHWTWPCLLPDGHGGRHTWEKKHG